jgi:hypothetical protein
MMVFLERAVLILILFVSIKSVGNTYTIKEQLVLACM